MSTLHVKATARILGARSSRGTSACRCIMRLRHASAVRGLYWLYNSWARRGTTAKPTPSPIAALVFPPSLFLEAVDRGPAGRASRSAATHATASTCHSCMRAQRQAWAFAAAARSAQRSLPALVALCLPREDLRILRTLGGICRAGRRHGGRQSLCLPLGCYSYAKNAEDAEKLGAALAACARAHRSHRATRSRAPKRSSRCCRAWLNTCHLLTRRPGTRTTAC